MVIMCVILETDISNNIQFMIVLDRICFGFDFDNVVWMPSCFLLSVLCDVFSYLL